MKKFFLLVVGASTILAGLSGWGSAMESAKRSVAKRRLPATTSPVKLTILQRTTEPLLTSDRPWEEFTIDWVNVIKLGDTWNMWYSSYDSHYKYDCDAYLCYAQSKDGVHWEKPNLGLVSYNGSKDNNILIDGPAIRANATTVFLDEHGPADQQYKALLQKFVGFDAAKHGIWQCFGAVSPDGLRWQVQPESNYPWNSDTQNVCFWDRGRYRMYLRLWRGVDKDGKAFVSTETRAHGVHATTRMIGLSESPTFSRFPQGQEILAPAADDPPDMDLYANACTKLKDDLYVMFISCYYKKEDVVRVQAAFSRDGKMFQRLGCDPILDLGKGFDSKSIYVGPGAIPAGKPHTYWFYYFGTAAKHNENVPQRVQHMGGIGRFLVEIQNSR